MSKTTRFNVFVYLIGVFIVTLISLAFVQANNPSLRLLILFSPILILLIIIFLSQPLIGLLLMIITIPAEAIFVVGDEISFTRILGFVVTASWLINLIMEKKSFRPIIPRTFFILTSLLLLFAFSSFLWARDTEIIGVSIFRLLRLFLFSLMVFDLINSWGRVTYVAKTLLVGSAAAMYLTINQYLQGNLTESGRAGANISGNLNNTATAFVTILPLAFYFIRAHEKPGWRILSWIYIVFTFTAVALTFSRSGILLLFLVMIIESWEIIKKKAGLSWLIFAIIFASGVFVFITPSEAVLERAKTIIPTLSYSVGLADETLDGASPSIRARGYIYRVGIQIFKDYPIIGVGFANFSNYYLEYQYIVPGSPKIVNFLLNPHSVYLAFLVELGLIGLGILILLMFVVWRKINSVNTALSQSSYPRQMLITKAITHGFLVQAIYGFASTIHFEKLLWLLLGLVFSIEAFVASKAEEKGSVQRQDRVVNSRILKAG